MPIEPPVSRPPSPEQIRHCAERTRRRERFKLLSRAKSATEKLFIKLSVLSARNDWRETHKTKQAVLRFLEDRYVRIWALSKSGVRLASADDYRVAAKTFTLQDAVQEPVEWYFKTKASGNKRLICELPPRLKALHRMLDLVIRAQTPNLPFLYSRRGRNHHELVQIVADKLNDGYTYHRCLDITSCYSSVNPDALYSLPLPRKYIRLCLDTRSLTFRQKPSGRRVTSGHTRPLGITSALAQTSTEPGSDTEHGTANDELREITSTPSDEHVMEHHDLFLGKPGNERHGSTHIHLGGIDTQTVGGHPGLMQGSPASSAALAYLLRNLPHSCSEDVFSSMYGDDVIVLAKQEAAGHQVETALADHLGQDWIGPLTLRSKGDAGPSFFEFLGYRFERDETVAGSRWTVRLSNKNLLKIQRDFEVALSRDMDNGDDRFTQVRNVFTTYRRCFPLATDLEQLLQDLAEDAVYLFPLRNAPSGNTFFWSLPHRASAHRCHVQSRRPE